MAGWAWNLIYFTVRGWSTELTSVRESSESLSWIEEYITTCTIIISLSYLVEGLRWCSYAGNIKFSVRTGSRVGSIHLFTLTSISGYKTNKKIESAYTQTETKIKKKLQKLKLPDPLIPPPWGKPNPPPWLKVWLEAAWIKNNKSQLIFFRFFPLALFANLH